ncbi:hypothetical protein [Oribacterium sp. WCC10]|uniref:hypothetical protein n=1 Tax=Oribacterium sp. WCC10 TaxID=1855343 RepID=UPI0008EF9F14|nr:extracellular solute-binding protein, family 3 [Oribacterium sp. WCC10]
MDEIVKERIPDAKLVYLNTRADLINTLETHKIDAYATDEPVLKILMTQHEKITMFPEYLETDDSWYPNTLKLKIRG